MNFLDIGIFLILFYNMFNGLRKGFIRSIFEIIALIGSIILALVYYASVGEGASKLLGIHFMYSSVISFIVLWLFGFFIIILIGRFVESFFTISIFSWLNILGGIVFGFCKGFIVLLPFILPMLYFSFPFAKDSFLINTMKPAFAIIIDNYLPKPLFQLNQKIPFEIPKQIISTENIQLFIKPKPKIVQQKEPTPTTKIKIKPKKVIKKTKNKIINIETNSPKINHKINSKKEINQQINIIKHKQKSRIFYRKQREANLKNLLQNHKISEKTYKAEIKKLRSNSGLNLKLKN
ncbi:MAG: CvpA family protein [Candidatus Margulisiibacteriota bacterium]|jgi:uncharacterized membrane protein required for colicin V production